MTSARERFKDLSWAVVIGVMLIVAANIAKRWL
jgi:hypothetical protein